MISQLGLELRLKMKQLPIGKTRWFIPHNAPEKEVCKNVTIDLGCNFAFEIIQEIMQEVMKMLRTHGNGRVDSIDDALGLLNAANRKLKQVAYEAGDAALDSAKDVREKAIWMSKKDARRLDQSAHENIWKFVGFTSAFSALAGYYFGRRSGRA